MLYYTYMPGESGESSPINPRAKADINGALHKAGADSLGGPKPNEAKPRKSPQQLHQESEEIGRRAIRANDERVRKEHERLGLTYHSPFSLEEHKEPVLSPSKDNLSQYLSTKLDDITASSGSEYEVAKGKSSYSPEGWLWQRLLFLGAEEISDSEQTIKDDFRNAELAFGLLAFPKFSEAEQWAFRGHLNGWLEIWKEQGWDRSGVNLTPAQAQILKMLAERVHLPYEPTATNFPFALLNENAHEPPDP
jgi:hypothetical protein